MRNYLLSVLAVAAATLAVLAGTNYIVDPFNRIRPNTSGVYLKAQEREMNPGVARSLKYDTVIVGSSMMENLDPAYVEELAQWKAINLAVEGSTGYEQRRNLEVALRTGQVKRVFWGVDWGSFAHLPEETSPGPGVPDFLYDDGGPVSTLKYVFNLSVLRASLKKLVGIGTVRAEQLGRLHNWNGDYHYGCDSIEVSERRFQRVGAFLFTHHKSGIYVRNLEANFVALVRANPAVQFYAVLPPYSAQWLRDLDAHNPLAMRDFLDFRRYMGALQLPNLKVYDFMADADLITSGMNYRDLAHFHERVNQAMFRRVWRDEPLPVRDHIERFEALPMRCR